MPYLQADDVASSNPLLGLAKRSESSTCDYDQNGQSTEGKSTHIAAEKTNLVVLYFVNHSAMFF